MNAKLELNPFRRPILIGVTQAFFSRKGDCTKADNQIRYIDIVIVLKTLKSNAVDNSLPRALSDTSMGKNIGFQS